MQPEVFQSLFGTSQSNADWVQRSSYILPRMCSMLPGWREVVKRQIDRLCVSPVFILWGILVLTQFHFII